MIQTILMVIAVFLIVLGIMSFTAKTIAFKETPRYSGEVRNTFKT